MILTRHAVERFIERFRREIEENKINVKHERAVRWLMYIFIENGQETKSHLNANFVKQKYINWIPE